MIRTAALFALAASAALAQIVPTAPPAGGKAVKPATSTAPAVARKPAAAVPVALPSYKDLKYPPLHPLALPPVETVTLPNGMRLYLMEDHELPLIQGTLLVRTGNLFDPAGKAGLSALTGQEMIDGGIASRPGDALLGRFHELGTEIDGTDSENSLSISFSALKDGSDEVLDMFKDLIIEPAFQPERLDFAKARMRNMVAHRNDEASEILRREFVRTLTGRNTPYGAQMEYASIDRINRGDLVEFHRRYFFPTNVMLAVEGDFDAVKMKARLAALFSEWKNDQPAVPEFPKLSTAGEPGKFLAVTKDPTRAYFAVGQLGADGGEKDDPALQILAEIIGRAPRGRLNQKLTGDTLSARWTPGMGHAGNFTISGAINPFRTARVLRAINQELTTIRTSEVSDEELRQAKDTVLNSLVFTFGSQLSAMPRLLNYEYYNFPKDYTEQYRKALEGVTRADILRVAKDRLDPARMTTLVVANPATFEVPLESLGGSVTPIDLTIPPPKTEAALGDPVTQRRGKEMLARAQQAMGGSEKLAAVADYRLESQYLDASGTPRATMTERWMPGCLRQDSVLTTGSLSVFFDGKTGWIGAPQGTNLLAGLQLKQVQGDLFRVLFPLVLSDRAAGRKVNALDENTVEVSDATGQLVKIVFDPATGLLKNEMYDVVTANGQVAVTETYSDYRDTGGLKSPFKVAISVNGDKFQEIIVKSIQFNTGLKLPDLEKRP